VRQLTDDGFDAAARIVAEATFVSMQSDVPAQRLNALATAGMAREGAGSLYGSIPLPFDPLAGDGPDDGLSLNAPRLETKFITTHKQSCKTARFSPDGKYVATGSADASIKLLDVSKMLQCTVFSKAGDAAEDVGAKPVIRSFHDHTLAVNDVAFHPSEPIVASASDDMTIKLFDFSKPLTIKRATKVLQDTHAVKAISFHPSGNYLLAGTEHSAIHLYDINNSGCCYTSENESANHTGPITQVEYSEDGSLYASSSKDGAVKLWDGVTNQCTLTIPAAHSGLEVYHVALRSHKDGSWLLTVGRDSTLKLWDVASGQMVRQFSGAACTHRRTNCVFAHKDLVASLDERDNAVCMWDVGSGQLMAKTKTDHKNSVNHIVASPVDNCLITCSEDQRARFWTY